MTYRLIVIDREIFMSQSIYAMDTDLLHSRALEIVPQNNITVELVSKKVFPKDSIFIIYYPGYYPLVYLCCDPNQGVLLAPINNSI